MPPGDGPQAAGLRPHPPGVHCGRFSAARDRLRLFETGWLFSTDQPFARDRPGATGGRACFPASGGLPAECGSHPATVEREELPADQQPDSRRTGGRENAGADFAGPGPGAHWRPAVPEENTAEGLPTVRKGASEWHGPADRHTERAPEPKAAAMSAETAYRGGHPAGKPAKHRRRERTLSWQRRPEFRTVCGCPALPRREYRPAGGLPGPGWRSRKSATAEARSGRVLSMIPSSVNAALGYGVGGAFVHPLCAI